MIQKIQLGGITRRPSDLSAKEGTCEESLNVFLDVNEVAPVIEPEDKTTSLLGNTADVAANTADKYIYIHKVGTYENYIALNGTTNEFFAYIAGVKSSALFDLDTLGETYQGITSVGKTLIISTDKNLHYILFKDGAYVHLGTKIPEPIVDFRAVPVPSDEGAHSYRETDDLVSAIAEGSILWLALAAAPHTSGMTALQFWNEIVRLYGTNENVVNIEDPLRPDRVFSATEIVDAVTDFVWQHFHEMRQQNRNLGIFSAPVFMRSALKLYDGSYVYQSVPYLLHRGSNATMVASQVATTNGGGISIALGNVYRVKATITYPNLADWGDIVRSVDIFSSTDVSNPKVGARMDGALVWPETGTPQTTYFKFLGQSDWQNIADAEEEILSKVNFYLIDSKNVEDISSGVVLNPSPVAQDDLLVKPTLSDDNLSHHTIHPKDGIMAYNSRLIMRGRATSLYSGHPFLQSMYFQTSKSGVFANDYMEFRYYIRTEDGETLTVNGRDAYGVQLFTYPTEAVGPTGSQTTYYGLPCGFLYYPDPRCYKCDIYYGSSTTPAYYYSVQMKEHPGLNGAYALCDLSAPVTSLATQLTATAYPSTESKVYTEASKLVMSESYNPFLFELTNRLTFEDAVLGVATTTKALSTGQIGQFPLYVFTEGGIWFVPISDTGAFQDPRALSRDVALSADSITPIDQAIVFVTAKGVMLLSGSDINELSPEMEGRHYAIENEVATLLVDTEWEKYLSILADKTPFMAFMRDARAVYDYPGRRLVFFNDKSALLQSYQYVYKMDTGTWHKTSLLQTSLTFGGLLNGYPEALVCMRNSSNVYRVYDLAVSYNPSVTQQTLSQVVITRPLDFNLPHVSKTLRRLFARGWFEKGNVQYLLLGSPDGQTYHVIHSLRGPSNNVCFRIMVFGTLAPAERLSFLELDYVPRFIDRPR